jgi:hypothetical protein
MPAVAWAIGDDHAMEAMKLVNLAHAHVRVNGAMASIVQFAVVAAGALLVALLATTHGDDVPTLLALGLSANALAVCVLGLRARERRAALETAGSSDWHTLGFLLTMLAPFAVAGALIGQSLSERG